MVELILSRHGETLENQRHLLQGQLPGTLSPLGLQQAEDLAERLKNETIDAVVSSDLDRSYRTALADATRGKDWTISTGTTSRKGRKAWRPCYNGQKTSSITSEGNLTGNGLSLSVTGHSTGPY